MRYRDISEYIFFFQDLIVRFCVLYSKYVLWYFIRVLRGHTVFSG